MQIGTQRRRWRDNIKTDVKEKGCKNQRWMELAQDHVKTYALISVVLKLRF